MPCCSPIPPPPPCESRRQATTLRTIRRASALSVLPQTKFNLHFREPVARRYDRFASRAARRDEQNRPRTENNPSRAVGRRAAKRVGEKSNLRKRIKGNSDRKRNHGKGPLRAGQPLEIRNRQH